VKLWQAIRFVAGGGMVMVLGAAALMLWPLLWPPDPDASVQLVGGHLVGETSGYVGRINRDLQTVDVSSSLIGWRPIVLVVNSETSIQVQNRQGGFGDLLKDLPVRVSYEVVGDQRIAKAIEIMTDDHESLRAPVTANGVVKGPASSAPVAETAPAPTPGSAAASGPSESAAPRELPAPATESAGARPAPAPPAPVVSSGASPNVTPGPPLLLPPSIKPSAPLAAAPTPRLDPPAPKPATAPGRVEPPPTSKPAPAAAHSEPPVAKPAPATARVEPPAAKPAPATPPVELPAARPAPPRVEPPAPKPATAAPRADAEAPRAAARSTPGVERVLPPAVEKPAPRVERSAPPAADADQADGAAAIDWLLKRR
jgi:hypothetical protein